MFNSMRARFSATLPFFIRGRSAFLLVVLAACGDVPLAPGSVAGTYALVAVDGEPIPAVMNTDASDALLLVADTMELHVAGTLTGRRCQRRIDYVNDASTESCWDYGGSYRVQVQNIDLSIGCQPGQVCTVVALRTAKLHGDELKVSREEPGGSLTFRRIAQ